MGMWWLLFLLTRWWTRSAGTEFPIFTPEKSMGQAVRWVDASSEEQLVASPSKGIQEGGIHTGAGRAKIRTSSTLDVGGACPPILRVEKFPGGASAWKPPPQQQRQGESRLVSTWHQLEPNEGGPAVAHPRPRRPNRPGPCTATRDPSGLAVGEAGRSAWLGHRGLVAGTAHSQVPQLLCRAKASQGRPAAPGATLMDPPILTGPSNRRLHPHQKATSLRW